MAVRRAPGPARPSTSELARRPTLVSPRVHCNTLSPRPAAARLRSGVCGELTQRKGRQNHKEQHSRPQQASHSNQGLRARGQSGLAGRPRCTRGGQLVCGPSATSAHLACCRPTAESKKQSASFDPRKLASSQTWLEARLLVREEAYLSLPLQDKGAWLALCCPRSGFLSNMDCQFQCPHVVKWVHGTVG